MDIEEKKRSQPVLAISRAGHDKGRIYVVWQEEDDFLYLVDGLHRGIEAPKKKKKMHVQRIIRLPEALQAEWSAELTNEKIRSILKRYAANQ